MPHPFGWKAEYYNGEAHFTPRYNAIKTRLHLRPVTIKKRHLLKKADPSCKDEMVQAFYDAFQDSAEFCDWQAEDIYKYAEKNIRDYFDGVRGRPLEQSLMAVEPSDNRVIGLALILINKDGECELDLLFVSPENQRQGLGTEMVSSVCNRLYETGIAELFSTYHICNDISRDWHRKMGFKEEYDQLFIRLKYAWYRDELERQEKLGLSEERDELMRQKERWRSMIKEGFFY